MRQSCQKSEASTPFPNMDAIREQNLLNVYVLDVPEQVSTDNTYREERYQT